MTTLLAIWARAKAIGPTAWAAMAAGIAIVVAYLLGRSRGRDAQVLDQLEHDDKVKDDQLEAAVRRPRTDADLDTKLRAGRL